MPQDIRQSPQFAQYLKDIGWKIDKVGKWYVYIRQFPILGSMVKIQRVDPSISIQDVQEIAKKYRAFKTVLELNCELRIANSEFERAGFKVTDDIYSPSKSIQIDLRGSEDEIFNRFSEAKRRAVRRALKNNIIVRESDEIDAFIDLKWGKGLISWMFRKNQRTLWKNFSPMDATVLLAYENLNYEVRSMNYGEESKKNILNSKFTTHNSSHSNEPVGGILMLFNKNVAYYWQACASLEGKKLFSPSLLVWEALKLSKKRGCTLLDFEGIADERFPKASQSWWGFTKFKEGFGGKEILYPGPLVRSSFSFKITL